MVRPNADLKLVWNRVPTRHFPAGAVLPTVVILYDSRLHRQFCPQYNQECALFRCAPYIRKPEPPRLHRLLFKVVRSVNWSQDARLEVESVNARVQREENR